MGYTTKFKGVLEFAEPLTQQQHDYLATICNGDDPQDCRDHEGWVEPGTYMCYIDLEMHPDGLCWNGAEKTYEMVACVNLVTRLMRERWPEFRLTGSLLAQGDEVGDVWRLQMDSDGIAHRTFA